MKQYLILALLFISTFGFSKSQNESFILEITDYKVKIQQSKKKSDKMYSVVLKNQSLKRVYAFLKKSGQTIKRLSLDGSSSQTHKVYLGSKEDLTFVPMSPPFESVNLKPGAADYEIP